jgi:hypothetical protein
MPFELGLAVAVAETTAGNPKHQWRVLEAVFKRLNQFAS